MINLIDRVEHFSHPMFVMFVVSKIMVGIGIGTLLASYLLPYAWPILIIGMIVSVICIGIAFKNK